MDNILKRIEFSDRPLEGVELTIPVIGADDRCAVGRRIARDRFQ